jgi:mitogen-activated protein kinase kinase kinase
MKDPAQQSPILVDQMISQFQILMKVAVEIKQNYLTISSPEPGWDLPPCVDENFDSVVLDAMKLYFKLLNWKLNANKNTFKEAEILEQMWGFSYGIGRQLESGDIEVAEQFRYGFPSSFLRLILIRSQCLDGQVTPTSHDPLRARVGPSTERNGIRHG